MYLGELRLVINFPELSQLLHSRGHEQIPLYISTTVLLQLHVVRYCIE